MVSFSEWYSIHTDLNHTGPAMYEFCLVVDGAPVPFGRMLATDPDGILVIGSTKCMASRLEQSRSAWRYGRGSSTMNWLYYLERFTYFLKLWPKGTYEYRFAVAGSVDEAKRWEEKHLKRYWCRFGEAPPLNGIIPNRYGKYGSEEAEST